MRNREKFITKRNEYDLMMTIMRRGDACPIKLVGAKKPDCITTGSGVYTRCDKCIERWLNEEAK